MGKLAIQMIAATVRFAEGKDYKIMIIIILPQS
jgi:hypothetical protein